MSASPTVYCTPAITCLFTIKHSLTSQNITVDAACSYDAACSNNLARTSAINAPLSFSAPILSNQTIATIPIPLLLDKNPPATSPSPSPASTTSYTNSQNMEDFQLSWREKKNMDYFARYLTYLREIQPSRFLSWYLLFRRSKLTWNFYSQRLQSLFRPNNSRSCLPPPSRF